MADIFISYASEDRSRVEPLAEALEDQGWSVWWDRTIPPGKSFDQVIQEAITAAKCVIVLWSEKSILSDWVKEEATIGKRRQILVPAKIDSVEPPLGFGLIQAADLTDWTPESSHAGFASLLDAISELIGPSPLKAKEAEEKRIEEERRRKQKEAEAKRKTDDEKRRKEEEELKRKSEEEERKRKEAEVKRKTEEEQRRREAKAEIKPDKLEPDAIAPSEPRKRSNALKFGVLAGVVVLLMLGGFFYYKYQQEQQIKETRIKLERFYQQIEELERSVAKVDDQEQLKGLYRQRDKLSDQVAAFSEKAIKVGLRSQSEQLQDRLKKFDTQLGNKEKELIAARKGRVFVASSPDNATVKILNINEPFQQGMELEPGKYHVQVSSEGYEPQERWIELIPGEEKRISFELAKIKVAEPTSPQKVITNSIGMKFVLIPAGSFSMGSQISPEDIVHRYGGTARYYKDEQPAHPVKITKPFYMQTTETTQGQWKKLMGSNPSHFKDCGDDCPVEQVSWNDAQNFIDKLNQMEGINKYRLPTEAEWEYACRAETTTAFSFGDEEDKLGDYVWYTRNSNGQSHPVGRKKPNAWDLYDMHGNVWEWCQDWKGDYPSRSVVDPKGPSEGEFRIIRGGGWWDPSWTLLSATRAGSRPIHSSEYKGFRVARDF